LATPLVLGSFLLPSAAQSNGVVGLDVKLHDMAQVRSLGRTGVYPNGVNGFAESTTACNVGTLNIVWEEPMAPEHPIIAFLIARERNGRLEQISDRSFVKHGFYATNSAGCGTCQDPNTPTRLGLQCTDTYATSNNGDNYYLAPADEVDPWLGIWTPLGSHFDRGEPDVGPPANNDGQRSLTRNMATALLPVGHRIRVLDQDLGIAGARYWYQAFYVIKGELEGKRGDNIASREFTGTWTGSTWSVAQTGSMLHGSVLQRWSGASITSATNGNDDGVFYVAVKVTGPVAGRYHYEYAVHNRDNHRAGSSLRLPICANAQVWSPGFRDVDGNAGNDWSFFRNGSEIAFTTTGNPLLWNTFYNFWFDSDAAPGADVVKVDQHKGGAGAAFVSIPSQAPVEMANLTLGPGCGNPSAPRLGATGTPPRATLGNTTFGLLLGNVAPNAGCFFLIGTTPADVAIGFGCRSYLDLNQTILTIGVQSDAQGEARLPIRVPNNPSLEGTSIVAQGAEYQPSGGVFFGQVDFSNGLLVRVGNAFGACQ
jgi:hypothetical protein